jgi:hypothetical protein
MGVEDALDGLYQYPGAGHNTARRALLVFVSPPWSVHRDAAARVARRAGRLLSSCAGRACEPTLFAVVGDAAGRPPPVGFAAIRDGCPSVAPALAAIIALAGSGPEFALGCFSRLLLTLAVVRHMRLIGRLPLPADIGRLAPAPGPLRRLLVSDIFIRTWMRWWTSLVLYAVNIGHCAPASWPHRCADGDCHSVLSPRGHLADRGPQTVRHRHSSPLRPSTGGRRWLDDRLLAAFVVGGLREIGEPARKSLILEFVHPDSPGRRSVPPASGASPSRRPPRWAAALQVSPTLPFLAARSAS